MMICIIWYEIKIHNDKYRRYACWCFILSNYNHPLLPRYPWMSRSGQCYLKKMALWIDSTMSSTMSSMMSLTSKAVFERHRHRHRRCPVWDPMWDMFLVKFILFLEVKNHHLLTIICVSSPEWTFKPVGLISSCPDASTRMPVPGDNSESIDGSTRALLPTLKYEKS